MAANFGGTGAGVVGVVFILTFASVGAFLAWKRPQNPIGWLLSAICFDIVRNELASVVQTALEPSRLWVWTSERH